ncbi:hypothetical protein [Streptomyces mirabilis]|uniref:hypothetical protein n=1 Tax=Streptomyces mirabilis TaxID=68239 RepID=UPI0032443184
MSAGQDGRVRRQDGSVRRAGRPGAQGATAVSRRSGVARLRRVLHRAPQQWQGRFQEPGPA